MPRGDGSVYQLPDGAFRGAYRYRDAAGKPHTLTVRAATKREARRLLDARRASLTAHGQVAHSTMTVGQWLDQWLRETVAPAESPRTLRTYGYAVRSYTAPLHAVQLSALTPAHNPAPLLRQHPDRAGRAGDGGERVPRARIARDHPHRVRAPGRRGFAARGRPDWAGAGG